MILNSAEYYDPDRVVAILKGNGYLKNNGEVPLHAVRREVLSERAYESCMSQYGFAKLTEAKKPYIYNPEIVKSAEQIAHGSFYHCITPYPEVAGAVTEWFRQTYLPDVPVNVLHAAGIGMGLSIQAYSTMFGFTFFDHLATKGNILELQKTIVPEHLKTQTSKRRMFITPYPDKENNLNALFMCLSATTTRSERELMALADGASSIYWVLQKERERRNI